VLSFRVTAGQVIECTECAAVLEAVSVSSVGGAPRQRPEAMAGDKGYSTRAIRAWCRRHGVRAVIPERRDQVEQRAHRHERKPRFEAEVYRARNIVERVIGWLKRLRRVAARAEKLAVRHARMISLALIARTANLLSDTT
jgi:transposase